MTLYLTLWNMENIRIGQLQVWKWIPDMSKRSLTIWVSYCYTLWNKLLYYSIHFLYKCMFSQKVPNTKTPTAYVYLHFHSRDSNRYILIYFCQTLLHLSWNTLNSHGQRVQPCYTHLVVLNTSDFFWPIFTYALLLSCPAWIAQATLYPSNTFHSFFLFTLLVMFFPSLQMSFSLLFLYCLSHNLQLFQPSTPFAHPPFFLRSFKSCITYQAMFSSLYPCKLHTPFYCNSYV